MQTIHASATATYLHCPHCRLASKSQPGDAVRPQCSRCDETGTTSFMYASPLNAAEMQVRLQRLRPLPSVRALGERVTSRLHGARLVGSRPAPGL